MKKLANIGLWVLQALLVVPFASAGGAKLLGAGRGVWAAVFRRYGYPDGFSLVVGAVELLGAAALLVPRFATYAAGALIVVMIGAGITHARHNEEGRIVVNLVLIALLAVVAWARRPRQ